MHDEEDLYECLGVGTGASEEEIRAAFRRLAPAHHPDRNPGDAVAERKFKKLSEAHFRLTDGKLRAEYDRDHGVTRRRATAVIDVPEGSVASLIAWANTGSAQGWGALMRKYGLSADIARVPGRVCDACGQVIEMRKTIWIWRFRSPLAVTHFGGCPEDPFAAMERLMRKV